MHNMYVQDSLHEHLATVDMQQQHQQQQRCPRLQFCSPYLTCSRHRVSASDDTGDGASCYTQHHFNKQTVSTSVRAAALGESTHLRHRSCFRRPERPLSRRGRSHGEIRRRRGGLARSRLLVRFSLWHVCTGCLSTCRTAAGNLARWCRYCLSTSSGPNTRSGT